MFFKGMQSGFIRAGVNLIRTTREAVDETICDLTEDWSDQSVKDPVGKLIVKPEFNLAAVSSEGLENPGSVERLERTFPEVQSNEFPTALDVFSGKTLRDSTVTNADGGQNPFAAIRQCFPVLDLAAPTPR
jgi:hypothetical protein